ncbi:MAG: GntR family transcriptional regulator [Candidatus Limiplasma sp.]|nr:GntR family transcriptional regulator [Candidatus Limiplasma sp.]
MPDTPLEKKSQNPLYQQLMRRLQNDVVAGVYPAGGRIPSEQVLRDTYGVSRVTVRKAMLDLVQEGLLVRKQGKGTFVADARLKRDLHHITSFSDACAGMGRVAASRVVELKRETARTEDVERLQLPAGCDVLELCRLRLCDGEPVMLEYNRFSGELTFLERLDVSGSLYDVLREHGLIPTRAIHDISLGHATPTVSRYLGTAVGEALLLLDEIVFDQQNRPLHTSRQWIRGDKFTFRI